MTQMDKQGGEPRFTPQHIASYVLGWLWYKDTDEGYCIQEIQEALINALGQIEDEYDGIANLVDRLGDLVNADASGLSPDLCSAFNIKPENNQ